MQKFSIPDDVKPYIEALKALARTGLHTFPLEESCLINLPVVATALPEGATAAERATEFVQTLERVVAKRLQGKDQDTASLLFALGDNSGVSMQDRYHRVAKLHNKTWTWDKNFRKEPLEKFLYAVYLGLYREGQELSRRSTTVVEPAAMNNVEVKPRPRIVGGDYRLVLREVMYNLPSKEGEPREVIDRREIEATADGVEAWRNTFAYWGQGTTVEPKITLFGSAGKLSIAKESPYDRGEESGRSYLLELKFPEPLFKKERAPFTIHWSQPVNFGDIVRDEHQDYWQMTPIMPTDKFTISVRFPEGRKPRSVWHYEDVPNTLAPGVATEANTIEIIGDAFVAYTWHELLVGCAYGIAWEW